ncbi:UDP-N-acetylglucosamine--N-acetylmuramyl-(pentapeptide) pyrophosphoryl-undecaprenol N-acetylglucosamine transferase [Pseudoflavitalea sp. X16]|uniref:UDP-N-acetylglucosamine--N-acetylmuramyl- (pentapeptide) pyrophosphoryl-undecaprenol N-acetylglucosamine transferase n=1 Tax=Paraflavitalea devenefica TaxID=2716334 RepID=UPI00142442E2|nr:UDP-N-acetylglucosamine--N-acetylmuramyl-(pentapeptide) pyrophosphoryl-undecaprenol N-acetylglucosamine transferase [Paraflavitalea devenefica]NII24260.1 UDP-N-acetylglucosamine--N-acetylmuramyl-(pentapeptide) pyrophosphoryl-undecaprenol N-acetylglucosamine transferase [Paraflavitalea devenefica]
MAFVNFNNFTRKPLVLIAPLDWGLGHTTRCIPLIRELINLGCDVIIACNSTQKELLQQEFPTIPYTHLAGYDIRYGQTRWITFARLVLQSLKILMKIKQEKRWLRHFLTSRPVDALISDNRFGLYTTGIPTVFMTHQLGIKTGLGSFADLVARRWNYRRIERFTTCWVPDKAGNPSLAGELSHPARMPAVPVAYIGGLSRFTPCTGNTEAGGLLIILSGPEPQRSIFEALLLQQVKDYKGRVTIVRGLPLATALPAAPENCTLLNHAPAAVLHTLICPATLVISRCGYTTVMDLLKLHKKTILVPTPGQAEQEYLAHYLQKQSWAYTTPQRGFVLGKALAEADGFPYEIANAASMEAYKPVLATFVAGISHREL